MTYESDLEAAYEAMQIAYARLRVSHDRLLAAAKLAVVVIESETHGFSCVEELQVAISAAEELTP